ncbi:zinc-ribbon domain-containing protein [Actinocorallia sp. B10E7]|uniref:tetratricopeptide repeat protein n=1 Tax=Actinocorallia sp. B10E7 TaxID=3153558 RepID=UPI00325DFFC4
MPTVLLLLILLLSPVPSARAHEHPGGSVDRAAPGAVRVETSARVEIILLDDRSQIRRFERTYEVGLGSGSGFTVSPEGVVVTSTKVVRSGLDPAVYAANRIFAEYYEQKIPADFSRHTLGTGDLDFRLRSCYPPEGSNSTCIATVTPVVKVFPFLNPASPEGLPAEILKAGDSPAAPAVLKVTEGGGTLPTVPLATTFGSQVKAADVLTFKDRPSVNVTATVEIAHFDPPGALTLLKDDREKLLALLEQDGDGAAIVDDTRSEVVGVVTSSDGTLHVSPAQDVQAVLAEAGVSAHRGPVDVVYETALAHYHDRYYSPAIPVLQQVLKLRPDHAVAIDHLREAQKLKGTPKEARQRTRTEADEKAGFPSFSAWTIGAAVLLVLALGSGVYLLRRPAPAKPAVDAPAAGPSPEAGPTVLDRGGPREEPPPGLPVWSADGPVIPREPEPGERPAYCTHCGVRLGPGHRFCGYCGHPAS